MGKAIEWVEVRRFSDTLEAQMVEQFLRDHELRVQRVGNGSTAGGLDRFVTVIDIRLLVPSEDVEEAREALTAMDTQVKDAPFRGPTPPEMEQPDGPAEKSEPARNPRAAFMLALLVPVGGGHFYARQNGTGAILALGILGGGIAAFIFHTPSLFVVSFLLVLIDALGAYYAARRVNAGTKWSAGKQRAWGFGAMVVAVGAGFGWTHFDAMSDAPRNAWEPPGTKWCGVADLDSCKAECDKGNAPSCVTLGQMLAGGNGTPQDPARAASLFARACDAKFGPGCGELGILYRDTPSLAKDPDDAWRAFNRGCQMGDQRSCAEQKKLVP